MNPVSQRFTDLIVWQKAHRFVLDSYKLANRFPSEELYGLVSQLKRASVSIPANIAEGFKKQTKPEKIRLMNIAQGSLEECRYYLILANDLGYSNTFALMDQLDEVSRLLDAYIRKVKQDHTASKSHT